VTWPLDSVIHPGRRRADVAWGVAVLAGLVGYEQVRMTGAYQRTETWLNGVTHLSGTPNPVTFLGFIAGVTLLAAAPAFVTSRLLERRSRHAGPHNDSFIYRHSGFRALFLPLMYACIPLVGADYLAVQLPKFFLGGSALWPTFLRATGVVAGSEPLPTQFHLLEQSGIVATQVAVVAVGAIASLYAAWRIAGRDEVTVSHSTTLARLGMGTLITALALLVAAMFLAVLFVRQPHNWQPNQVKDAWPS
jgi:hypothetical protein